MPSYKNRLDKSLSEKIYILAATQLSDKWTFKVRGQSKNIYEQVLLSTSFSCSCPDHRTKRSFCKHLLYLIARVAVQMDLAYNLSDDKNLWNDTIYTICNDSWVERLKSRISKPTHTIEIGSDCSICFEEMKETDLLTQCISTCKNYFHKECITLWINSSHDTCPLCRADWIEQEEEVVISLAKQPKLEELKLEELKLEELKLEELKLEELKLEELELIEQQIELVEQPEVEPYLIMNVNEISTIGEFKKEIYKSAIYNEKINKKKCMVYYEITTTNKISNSKISDENYFIIIDKETNIIYRKNEANMIAIDIISTNINTKYDIFIYAYSSKKILTQGQRVLFI